VCLTDKNHIIELCKHSGMVNTKLKYVAHCRWVAPCNYPLKYLSAKDLTVDSEQH